MNHLSRSLFLVLCTLLAGGSWAQQKGLKIVGGTAPTGTERRLALVIGNQNYRHNGAKLANPISDADSMKAALESLGFKVIKKTDLDRVAFEQSVDEFGRELRNYDVGMFYYSGHGLQLGGENYLVPTDANISSAPEIEYKCVKLGRLQATMEGSQVKVKLVMLDACRDTPYPRATTRGATAAGFTIPSNPPGSMMVFATRAGATANDNPDERNGLFTNELLQHIRVPGRGIREIVDRTIEGVERRSNGNQVPGRYDELKGDFVFLKPLPAPPPPPAPAPVVIEKPVPTPVVEKPRKELSPAALAAREQLRAEMAHMKRKKGTLFGLGLGGIGIGIGTYLIANNSHNSYLNEVAARNRVSVTPITPEGQSVGPIVLAGAAVAGGLTMWILKAPYARKYRELLGKYNDIVSVRPLYNPLQQTTSVAIALRF
jgi:hypothetical protein